MKKAPESICFRGLRVNADRWSLSRSRSSLLAAAEVEENEARQEAVLGAIEQTNLRAVDFVCDVHERQLEIGFLGYIYPPEFGALDVIRIVDCTDVHAGILTFMPIDKAERDAGHLAVDAVRPGD